MKKSIQVKFEFGSLVCGFENIPENTTEKLMECGLVWDTRTKNYRASADSYKNIILTLENSGELYTDDAKNYQKLELCLKETITPRHHQAESLKSWIAAGGRGVVSLPTGAGKTILAVLAILSVSRPTLIVVPTIDLVLQWQQVLSKYFSIAIGAIGGGQKDIQSITVSTYDSAVLMIEKIGNQFGFLVVDECHHLPAPQYQMIAIGSIAPFRLGLSATPERADGKEDIIYKLLGDLVYEGSIAEMISDVLAPYDVVSVKVALTEEEKIEYEKERSTYLGFVKKYRINFSSKNGWQHFIAMSARSPGGREAMKAYRKQRKLAKAASGKITAIWDIFKKHIDDKIIVFTDDNDLAYSIARNFILPVITHQTKIKERKFILDSFKSGEIKVVVTSKVLNEGVDVPDASVAIVVSGSGGVREHVQRLGRILRQQPGKRARLYELIADRTNEQYVNQRRRQHNAYQTTSELPN